MSKYCLSPKGGANEFPLWCAFVDNFMKNANPTFVTVYLYGLRQCFSDNPQADIASCANSLGILESDVVRAWRYWESVGVVRLTPAGDEKNFGIEFVDLSKPQAQTDAPAVEAPRVNYGQKPAYEMGEISSRMASDQALCAMYDHAQAILEKTLSQSEVLTLYSLYDWLALPPEVILTIIGHCKQLGHKSMRYIEKVAISWADLGIDTLEKADKHLAAREKASVMKKKFKKMFKISDRDLSDAEYAHLVQWSETLGFSDELIFAAYEKTVQYTGKVSFAYMNSILQAWYKEGIKNLDQVKKEEQAARRPARKLSQKNNFTGYAQSGSYDLDEIEKMEMALLMGDGKAK